MGWIRIFVWLVLTAAVMLSGACLPKTIITGIDPGRELFGTAENQFNQGFYNNAFQLYQDYLAQFPKGEAVPEALLRLGDIYLRYGAYDDARRQYRQLVERFPGERSAEDAMIGILVSWFNEKAYEKVLAAAAGIDDHQVSDDCLIRKYGLISDAYLAMDEPVDAAYVLMAGLKKVGTEGQNRILAKLSPVLSRIDVASLQNLLADVDDPGFRGYLSCQIAERYMQKEEYGRAVALLTDYITAYPDNAYAAKAAAMMENMERSAVYDRHAIGCLLPLSGKYSLFGERALRGIQIAFQEFITSSAGKGSTFPLKLVIEDTGSNPEKALAAARALADKQVAAIIGPLVPYKAAVEEAADRHIPIITLTQDEDIPGLGRYVFRNFLTPGMQVASLVRYACLERGMRKFAVLYPDEEYGRVFADKFWDEILKYGGEMVGFESYLPTETDFAEPIKKLAGIYYDVPDHLKEARERYLAQLGLSRPDDDYPPRTMSPEPSGDEVTPSTGELQEPEIRLSEEEYRKDESDDKKALVDFEALFIPDGPSRAGLIIPQLVFYDLVDIQLMGTNLWFSRDLLAVAGGYVQGAVFPADFWDNDETRAAAIFSRRYESIYNEKPGFVSAVAYDTAMMLMRIMADVDVRYRHDIIDRLEKLEGYPGATGVTSFDDNGEVVKDLTLLKIQGNRFVAAEPDGDGLVAPWNRRSNR